MSVQRGRLAGREAGPPPRPRRPRAAAVPGRAGGAGRGGGGRRRVPAEPGRRLDPRAARRATEHVDVDGPPAARREQILRLDADPDAIARPPRRRPAARPVGPRRAGPPHPRATRTRPSSRCARCSASRSPSPPRARSPGGWSRPPASRWTRRSAAITHRFPTPAALAALDPDALPMPRARARALVGMAGEPVRRAPAGGRAVDGGLRRAALRRRRRVPADRPGRQARPRRARRGSGAPPSSPRRGARTARSRWRICGPRGRAGGLRLGREAREPAARRMAGDGASARDHQAGRRRLLPFSGRQAPQAAAALDAARTPLGALPSRR